MAVSNKPCWEFPHRWRQVAESLMPEGTQMSPDTVRLLEERDRALEDKLCTLGSGVTPGTSVPPVWVDTQGVGNSFVPSALTNYALYGPDDLMIVWASKAGPGIAGTWVGGVFDELEIIDNFKSAAIRAAFISDLTPAATYGYSGATSHQVAVISGVLRPSSALDSSLVFYYNATPVSHGSITTPAGDATALYVVRDEYNLNATVTMASATISGTTMVGTVETGPQVNQGLFEAGLSSPGLHAIDSLPGGTGGGAADSFAGCVVLPAA